MMLHVLLYMVHLLCSKRISLNATNEPFIVDSPLYTVAYVLSPNFSNLLNDSILPYPSSDIDARLEFLFNGFIKHEIDVNNDELFLLLVYQYLLHDGLPLTDLL